MRKSLLKTIVATAVVGATLALTSVAAMAEVYTTVHGTDVWDGGEELAIDGSVIYAADKEVENINFDNYSGTCFGLTLNNVKVSNGNNGRLALAKDNTSYIEITPSIDLVFNATIGNKGITVVQGDDSTNYSTGAKQIELEAGKTYKITRDMNASGTGTANIESAKLTTGSIIVYSWSLDKSNLTFEGFNEDDLVLGTSTSPSNTLSYDSTNSKYELDDAYKNLTTTSTGVSVSGTSVTVTPQNSWFNKKPDAITGVVLTSSLTGVDVTGTELTSNTTVKGFTITATSSKKVTITNANAGTQANGESITKRIALGGAGSTGTSPYRTISFTTQNANAKVYVWGLSTSGDTRTLNVVNSSGTTIGTISAPANTNTTVPGGYVTLATAGTYSVTSAGSGIDVFLIGLVDKAETVTQSKFIPVSMVNYNDKTYIIGSISKDEMENVYSVGLAGSKTNSTLTGKNSPATNCSSDTVYKAIVVGGKTIIGDADEANPSTYYYAVQLNGTVPTCYVKGFAQLEENGNYVAGEVETLSAN